MKITRFVVASLALLLSFSLAEEKPADPLAAISAKVANPEKPFTLVVKIAIKPGTEEAFKEAAKKAVEGSRQEKGNMAYEVHQSADDPTKFVFFEKWRSLEALKSHFDEEYTKGILAALGEVGAGEPVLEVYTPFLSAKKKPAK